MKNNYTVLSDKRCTICNKRLKQNLIDKKPNANMCYKHYQIIIKKNPVYL